MFYNNACVCEYLTGLQCLCGSSSLFRILHIKDMWYVIYIIIYCTKDVFWILLKYVWKLFWAFLIFLNIRSMCLCGSSSGSTRLIWWRGRAAIGGKVRYCSFSPYSHSSFFLSQSHSSFSCLISLIVIFSYLFSHFILILILPFCLICLIIIFCSFLFSHFILILSSLYSHYPMDMGIHQVSPDIYHIY